MAELPPSVRALVDASVDAACIVDADLEVLHYNARYLLLAGLRPRALVGRKVRGMCHDVFGLETCAERCVSRRAFETRKFLRMDEVGSSKLPLRLIVVAIPLIGDDGEVYAVLEQYRDVTAESRLQDNYRRLLDLEREQKARLAEEVARQTVELEQANASLRKALSEVSRLARVDGLTGLYNRRYFDEQLGARISEVERNGASLALVLFDLDHFKRVNDVHGHPAGDQLLKEFARVLTSCTRDHDVVARVGGEEFALILPGAHATAALGVAARIQARARQAGLLTTASGGIAVFGDDGRTSSDLLRAADRALYAAKHTGRDRVLIASTATGAAEAA